MHSSHRAVVAPRENVYAPKKYMCTHECVCALRPVPKWTPYVRHNFQEDEVYKLQMSSNLSREFMLQNMVDEIELFYPSALQE